MSTLGKRDGEDISRPNKRARQREQKRVAHQIAVQPAASPASASTSTLAQAHDGASAARQPVVTLPAQMLVEEQLSAHAFEAQSLLKAIRTSSTGNSVRAWQMLPRAKRRRNASHNLLALPKRLRAKGRAELRASSTTPRSRAVIRRRKGKGDREALGAYPRRKEDSRRARLIERAASAVLARKTWLETHLWHAKRFRMSGREGKKIGGVIDPLPERWGFNLAEESTMKSFRSSWRDDKAKVTVMDQSYDAWFRVSATVRRTSDVGEATLALQSVLQRAGVQSGWQAEWTDGGSFCDTIIATSSEASSEQAACLRIRAPVQVVWVTIKDDATSIRRLRREVLVRTHPACTAQVERCLRQAILPSLRGSDLHARVDVSRLNNIAHPLISAGSGAAGRTRGGSQKERGRKKKSSKEAITNPHADAFETALQNAWKRQQAFNVFELSGPASGALLAKVLVAARNKSDSWQKKLQMNAAQDGQVFSVEVHDPRLSFPPRARPNKVTASNDTAPKPAHDLLSEGALLPTYRSGEIQSRRSHLLTPGARMLPTSKDDIVPVTLMCRSNRRNDCAWTLLVPRGWGRAFWLSLVHSDTRVLGQAQWHALRFDRGRPTFPHDWVGTPGFEYLDSVASQRAFMQWERTPPAKRCNFDATGARWPFGGKGMWEEIVRNGIKTADSSIGRVSPSRPPWTFALMNVEQMDPLIDVMRRSLVDKDDRSITVLQSLQSAVLCVSLTACRKGSFAKWDEVHFLPSEVDGKWKRALQAVEGDKAQRKVLQALEQRTLPKRADSLIGSVTTGHFSLSNGQGMAIGSVSLLAYLSIAARSRTSSSGGDDAMTTTDTAKRRNPIQTDNLVVVQSVNGGPQRAASMRCITLR